MRCVPVSGVKFSKLNGVRVVVSFGDGASYDRSRTGQRSSVMGPSSVMVMFTDPAGNDFVHVAFRVPIVCEIILP